MWMMMGDDDGDRDCVLLCLVRVFFFVCVRVM